MPTRPKIVQARTTSLKGSISDTETGTISLRKLVDLYGNNLSMTDFGDQGYIVIDPGLESEEIVKFTGFTTNSDDSVDIDTGITRAMVGKDPYGSGGTASSHDNGATVVVSNTPQIYDDILDYIDAVETSGAASADTTSEGVVEIATASEIDSGTEKGSTGSFLAIPPDALGGSKYSSQLPTSNEKTLLTNLLSGLPGVIAPYAGTSAPTDWLLCDGSLVSATTYSDLFDVIVDLYGNDSGTAFTVDTSTDELIDTGHSLSVNDRISVSNSGGSLPGGLSANTAYWVISTTTDRFKISATQGGGAIDITSTGSGTHSYHTQINVPDLRGRFPLGKDDMGGSSANTVTDAAADTLGGTGGSETHTLTASEIPAHSHSIETQDHASGAGHDGGEEPSGGVAGPNSSSNNADAVKDNTGGGGAHENMSPYITLNYIIHI